MSFWDKVTKPVDKVLDSDAFKAVMPVQALGQEAVKLGTGAVGINRGQGLTPSTQYAIGGGTGAALAGGSALMSPGPGAGMTPYMPTSTPNMGAAGSTLGAGGSSSPLSLGGYGSSGGAGAGAAPVAPTSSSSPWENHAQQGRYTSDDQKQIQQYHKKSAPPMPQIGAPLPGLGQ